MSSQIPQVSQKWSGCLTFKSTFEIAIYQNTSTENLHHISESDNATVAHKSLGAGKGHVPTALWSLSRTIQTSKTVLSSSSPWLEKLILHDEDIQKNFSSVPNKETEFSVLMVMLMKTSAHFNGAGHARWFDPEAQPYRVLQVWNLIWNVPLSREASWGVNVQLEIAVQKSWTDEKT